MAGGAGPSNGGPVGAEPAADTTAVIARIDSTAAPEPVPGSAEAGVAGRIRRRIIAFSRSLAWMAAVLAALCVVGVAGDVLLHRVIRTTRETASYPGIYAVDVVLDGDGTVSVNGAPGNHTARLVETDSAVYASPPVRTLTVIGSTLYITVSCANSLCRADLALAVNPGTALSITDGNALRADQAEIAVSGMSGQISVVAWPARVKVTASTSTVTGIVLGRFDCVAPANCAGVAKAP